MDILSSTMGSMRQRGMIHLLPVFIVLAVLSAGAIFTVKNNISPTLSPPEPSSTPVPSPSATPTVIPTATPVPVTPTPPPTGGPKPEPPAQSGPPGAGLTSVNVATEKGNFKASILMIDLNGAKMVTDTGNDGDCGNDCTTLPLKDYVARNNGFAGVNGSYFCPDAYPECSGKKNSFDFPVYNSRLLHWNNQGNLFWDNRAIVYFDGTGAHYLQNAKDFNGSLSAGIVNYPGLLNDGNVQIDDNQSGLSDKQKAKGTKVGLGVSSNRNIMVVIAQNINMQEFAHVFKSLGAKGALNLDTGGSTALYYNGSYIFGPGRNLPNAIIFSR